MDSQTLRLKFIDFFVKKQHTSLGSSSLVPQDDPTLLFTNAGMVQFKNVFLGHEKRDYTRATTIQKCVRAGGKHNDLENVGYTARHHTFFEMMGNFSFGDYFKREAIQFAWEFLTQIAKLPKEKLWVTVFEEDNEAADIWLKEIGIDPNRFSRIDAKDNFWAMGDTGPCGPCTEIFYDHGPEIAGGPPGSADADGDRYIEIWNLVFMQFNRQANGELLPLPKPSVDTGMGLERIAAVLQGVHDNYDIDTFKHIIKAIAELAGISELGHKSLRVIADHIRSTSFLIADGVIPSNEGRGYVLRRIIRRAIRHGHKLGINEIFFYKLVRPLVEIMGEAYPELVRGQSSIELVLNEEEQQFKRTLEQGLKILEQDLTGLKSQVIPGEVVFKLYDTYGFPVDLTADIARERDLQVDLQGFEACMEQQRQRARASSQFNVDYNESLKLDCETHFVGYEHLAETSEVLAIIKEGKEVKSINAGDSAAIVLSTSPFYAESGGQVGDKGTLSFSGGEFMVEDTKKQQSAFMHYGKLAAGELRVGMVIEAKVNTQSRQQTALNHSATHLLHQALREVLGAHVEQKGSLVQPDRLRFDFSHFTAMTPEQIRIVEDRVNANIRENLQVETIITTPDQAKNMGAMALFGEKYGDEVRVLKMGDFSIELCGGTHVHATGQIGSFIIISEAGVAAGIRRVEALTGEAALNYMQESRAELNQYAAALQSNREGALAKLAQTLEKLKLTEKELQQLRAEKMLSAGANLADQAQEIGDIKVLACKVDIAEPKALPKLVDELKVKLNKAVIVLAIAQDNKVSLIAGVTDNLTQQIKAGELVNFVAQQVGGKGGGKADLAQAGGTQVEHLEKALHSVVEWVKAK
ncbi:MAG: alanyl-tRNA synthetase [Gammaproteobacteria bacterium]|jgi:alanyl-tRNA synthetase|nr:alanyl-tRNA synthetase [Gammaproteobacteria bacterium]